MAYRNRRGSLNTGRRVEQAVGMLAKLTVDVHAPKHGMELLDFMPNERELVEKELTAEENLAMAMREWM